jgi:glycine/D-amino acid oxidase-like deaminating enzyme
MNLHSALPYSLIKYGLPFDYPKLRNSIHADVVILGGGISGSLLAYYLSEENINCILLDKRTIGLGSTCASTNLLQYELDVPLFKLINLRGAKQAVRAYDLCKNAISELKKISDQVGLDDFQSRNSLYFAGRRKDIHFLKKEFSARKKYGFQVEWLNQSELKDRYGLISSAAILSQHGGYVNSYLLTHALLQYAQKKGINVYDDTNVVSIEHRPENVILKTDEGLIIEGKKLVYATGYEVTEFINRKIVRLQSTYAIASSTMEYQQLWKDEVMMWNTSDPYLYLRTTNDRRIMMGGRDASFINPKKRDALLHSKTEQLKADFEKLFPEIPLEVEFEWSGIFGTTKDGLPFIGPYKKLPNCFFLLGFGGNGITFSEVGARIITDQITGKRNTDAAIFSFERS